MTGKPASVTGAAAPAYPDGPLACGATAANPVTQGSAGRLGRQREGAATGSVVRP